MRNHVFKYVAFKEKGIWNAQCVDIDVGAQSLRRCDLYSNLKTACLKELCESLLRTGSPFKGVGRPPEKFTDMWDSNRFETGLVFVNPDEVVPA